MVVPTACKVGAGAAARCMLHVRPVLSCPRARPRACCACTALRRLLLRLRVPAPQPTLAATTPVFSTGHDVQLRWRAPAMLDTQSMLCKHSLPVSPGHDVQLRWRKAAARVGGAPAGGRKTSASARAARGAHVPPTARRACVVRPALAGARRHTCLQHLGGLGQSPPAHPPTHPPTLPLARTCRRRAPAWWQTQCLRASGRRP